MHLPGIKLNVLIRIIHKTWSNKVHNGCAMCRKMESARKLVAANKTCIHPGGVDVCVYVFVCVCVYICVYARFVFTCRTCYRIVRASSRVDRISRIGESRSHLLNLRALYINATSCIFGI